MGALRGSSSAARAAASKAEGPGFESSLPRFSRVTSAAMAGGSGSRAGAVALAAALGLIATVGTTVTGPATASASSCRHADATHLTATTAQLERATICLINQVRHAHGKPRLDPNAKLADAAARHTKTMLAEDCLAHRCPGEPSLGRRIRRSGYLKGADSWRYAENLGCAGTPRQMVTAWRQSHFNRKNLLNGKYRDVGVGAGRGVPLRTACPKDPSRSTFTALFASRQP
jgi:uncharacterized protein YkwD